MSDSQPISTAPKGGEPDVYGHTEGPILLVWLPHDEVWWPARWAHNEGEEGRWYTMYSECMGMWTVSLDRRPGFAPTRWLPFPAPPKEAASPVEVEEQGEA